MNILGSMGQIYMFILLILLFLGVGFALWSFINFIINYLKGASNKESKRMNKKLDSNTENNNIKIGGLFMSNNNWLKLAVFSLVGILVSIAVLGLISSNGMNGNANAHSQQQQAMTQNGMNMNGNMNMGGNMQMGNMQSQGSMNMNGNMQTNGMPMTNDTMMQQQLNQMQQQLNMMQQQMGTMNGNMNTNNMNNTNNSSNMNNMQPNNNQQSGSGGGMGMM